MTDLHVVAPTSQRDGAADCRREWAGPAVPAGHVVQTGYAPIHDVVCHVTYAHQLYPAEVERAYRRQLGRGNQQTWPPPTGYWREDGRFVLSDGRNRYVAALMLGLEYLFVAWLEPLADEI